MRVLKLFVDDRIEELPGEMGALNFTLINNPYITELIGSVQALGLDVEVNFCCVAAEAMISTAEKARDRGELVVAISPDELKLDGVLCIEAFLECRLQPYIFNWATNEIVPCCLDEVVKRMAAVKRSGVYSDIDDTALLRYATVIGNDGICINPEWLRFLQCAVEKQPGLSHTQITTRTPLGKVKTPAEMEQACLAHAVENYIPFARVKKAYELLDSRAVLDKIKELIPPALRNQEDAIFTAGNLKLEVIKERILACPKDERPHCLVLVDDRIQELFSYAALEIIHELKQEGVEVIVIRSLGVGNLSPDADKRIVQLLQAPVISNPKRSAPSAPIGPRLFASKKRKTQQPIQVQAQNQEQKPEQDSEQEGTSIVRVVAG